MDQLEIILLRIKAYIVNRCAIFSIKILFWTYVTQYHLNCEPGHP